MRSRHGASVDRMASVVILGTCLLSLLQTLMTIGMSVCEILPNSETT